MGVEARDHQTPLVESSFSASSIQPIKRTGVLWTAVAHIITGVIGSGVLSLAWSVAQLGWIAGPLIMLIFASITIVSAFSLCNCYRSPDPLCGPTRNTSYLAAVRMILGKRSAVVSSIFLRINYCKVGIVYTITAATSIRAILKSNCYHKEGHQAACDYGYTSYMLFFGFVQIVMSQIPNFRETEWLSIVASIMSFSYSIIGSALGLAKVIGDGSIKGSIGGVPTSTAPQKVWLVSQAIGDIAFAFPFSVILIEIQDTLKSPPPEKLTMQKASATAISITTFFYLCCGGFGYAAFGNSAPGNLLTGFGFYEPYWLIDFANACIILHLVGGYQMKLYRYWKVERQLQRERVESRALTRCIQELRMKGASFDLSKEPQNAKRMKSSSVEIKWKPLTWCYQNLLTMCLLCFAALVSPASKLILCV